MQKTWCDTDGITDAEEQAIFEQSVQEMIVDICEWLSGERTKIAAKCNFNLLIAYVSVFGTQPTLQVHVISSQVFTCNVVVGRKDDSTGG